MSASAKTLARAPWRSLFDSHISKMDSPEFVFTSLEATKDENSPVPYLPRARTCIFRGFWAELPENQYNEAPKNDRVYESDLLTLTTDVRMSKVPQIMSSSRGHGDVSESQGSGGGGPVEAVFWVKETKTQWRISGQAYIIAPDIEGPGSDTSSGVATVKHEVGERMRVLKEEGKKSWSWGTELTSHFGNLSPGMRGSFKNPEPGSPVSIPVQDPELKLGQKVDDLHDEIARKNFRVVIIRPDNVDQVDLTDPARGRRWRYTYVGAAQGAPGGKDVGEPSEWTIEETWP
ncbi:pyridoxamine 5'-phosphate oxidase-domain-containing protein [Bisporella sp. PMI_857]|nr:pyridoxamine 5'-phosphate oxidase-domain-containing protein [Bisporella sp. PMI_857]